MFLDEKGCKNAKCKPEYLDTEGTNITLCMTYVAEGRFGEYLPFILISNIIYISDITMTMFINFSCRRRISK
jgi:hypothetical protein